MHTKNPAMWIVIGVEHLLFSWLHPSFYKKLRIMLSRFFDIHLANTQM